VKQGRDVLILAIGSMVYPAVEAGNILRSEGIYPTVVNVRFLKPLDILTLEELILSHNTIITVEENVITGGLFGAIAELINILKINKKVIPIGLPDKFIEQGNVQLLRDIYGLNEYKIAEKIISVLEDIKV